MNANKDKRKIKRVRVNRMGASFPALLKRLYWVMLKIRFCEESLVQPIIDKRICCPVHLCTGQEAVAAGVCAVLTRRDYVFGNHRSHGHYLAKGGDLKALVAEVYGKQAGCSRGRGGSMHVIDTRCGFMGSAPIVAGTISLATGAALAALIRREPRVVVSFFGDGATGEGVLYESLNLAALHRLPILFVCENNFYSTHLPISECRAQRNLARSAAAQGVTAWRVDGNDVRAVYNAASRAVKQCRSGQGPVFLEFLTYRMRGHVGPDDNVQGERTDIRPPAEIARWRGKDPIVRLERHLLQKGILSVAEQKTIQTQVLQEVEAAHEFARRSPFPSPRDLKHYVFHEKG